MCPGSHQRVYARPSNVASFEWSSIVPRARLGGGSRADSEGCRPQASHFDAASASFPGRLMWHRRFDSRLTVDGEAHGPARGSPSAECDGAANVPGSLRATLYRRLRASSTRYGRGAILRSVPRRGVLPVEEGSTSIVAGLVE